MGHGVLSETGKTIARLGFKSHALMVTGNVVYPIVGEEIELSLKSAGVKSELVRIEASTDAEAAKVEAKIRASEPSVVLGVGGGKDIDVAKLASARSGVSFVSVPTAASHDGIASPVVSVKGADRPFSVMAQAPVAILADLGVIVKSPYRMLASGCGDIVAKYTAVRDWRLAHRIKNEYYGDYAADLALMSARLVMKNAHAISSMSEAGVSVVVEALISCGVAMSIAGSSRPCSGAEHLFSHALNQIAPKPAMHGEQCGVGTILCAYLHGANWELIRDVLQRIGAPTTAKQLAVEDEHVIEALTKAHKIRPERYTILGETGLTREAAEKVSRVTGVTGK